MNSEEKTILTKTVKRVNYYLQKRYDKMELLVKIHGKNYQIFKNNYGGLL